jgi:hypothetical protein
MIIIDIVIIHLVIIHAISSRFQTHGLRNFQFDFSQVLNP